MKIRFALILATAWSAQFACAADVTSKSALDAAEKRYAEDRKLCADEPDSNRRMQCLRDARAEYDKAIGVAAPAAKSAAKAVACPECGVVSNVRVTEKQGEGGATGMIAGGVVGALLGNQIGKGTTRDVATIAGAAGGAYAGKKIEENARTVKRWEVSVRFDSGEEKAYFYDKDPGFAIGSAVKASGGSLVAR